MIQPTLFAVPDALAAIVVTTLAVYAFWQGRRSGFDRTLVSFLGIVSFGALWAGTRALYLLLVDKTSMLVVIPLVFTGYGGAMLSVFFFSMSYSNYDRYLTRRTVALVASVPALMVVGAATNWYHSLLWTSEIGTYQGVFGQDVLVPEVEYTPVFLAVVAYLNLCELCGFALMLKHALTSAELYHRQVIAFVVGTLTAMVIGTMHAAGVTPFVPPFLDILPFGLTIVGLCYGYAVLRYRMLDVVPVARKTLVSNIHEGFLALDTRDRIVDCNDVAASLLGPRDEIISKPIDSVPTEFGELVAAHEPGTRLEEELTVEQDGDRRFLRVAVSSMYGDDGSPIGRLLLFDDITDRRRVRARYQALIENASDLMLILDVDGTITYASPSVRNVLGVEPETIVGRDSFELVHEDDRHGLETIYDEVLEAASGTSRVEFRTKDADGNWRVMEGIVRNMLEHPFVGGIVVNARDITERKERERELERTNEELEHTNEQLEQFASVVSHDLRNPLNVAEGYIDVMEQTDRTEHLDDVAASLDRMGSIIDDVLALARQGSEIEDVEPVELRSIAEEAWTTVDTAAATLTVSESARIAADPSRLRQALENLFRNAIEHGGDDVTVTLGVDENAFYVEDDGPGIPADEHAAVLESGYTTNEDGTGFGLAIVSEIAAAHDWELTVEEGTTGGARFRFAGVRREVAASR